MIRFAFARSIEHYVNIGILQRCCLLATTLLLAAGFCPNLLGTEPEVTTRKKVNEGLEHYSAGRFSEAAQAFEQASEKSLENSPESTVVLFDQACALRAAGEIAKARDLFLQVAIGDDKKLVSDSHHNLAAIAADEGRQTLGEDPLTTETEQREKALERLRAAVSHYRNSLRSDSQNEDSRHNMELVRLFIKHLEDEWYERDLQQMRDKKDLFQFLGYLDQQQSQLRDRARELESSGTRVSRLERTKLAESQKKLLDEISPLKAKIDASLQPEGAGNTPPTSQIGGVVQQPKLSAEEQAAIQELKQMIAETTGRAEKSIAAAAEAIQAGRMAVSMQEQQSTCERFYEIYTVLAPFQQVLQRAIDDQQSLIDRHKQPNEDVQANGNTAVATNGSSPNSSTTNAKSGLDFEALAWRQDWITKFGLALSSKAAAMLQAIPAEPEAGQLKLGQELGSETEPTTEPQASDDTSPQSMENSNDEMLVALRRALEKAVESSPAIVEHSKLANQGLLQRQSEVAEPQQQEVLRLLKEIADLLPKQPPQDQEDQQQDQDQKDQSQQNQDDKQKQDKDQQSQESKDQQKDSQSKDKPESDSNKSSNQSSKSDNQPQSSEQQSKLEEKGEQQSQAEKGKQKSDKSKPEEAQANESKSDSQSASEAQAEKEAAKQNSLQQKLAEERAQVILRRVREREAKYRELLEQLRQIQGQRSPVDKDW